jgi:SAM-dependent methyltransferase
VDVRDYNRRAWNKQVERKSEWTIPVSADLISAARQGQWHIILTPTKPVPKDWFPEMQGRDVLCLASGGGQQTPILAAAGAKVTVLDNSPKQLAQDRLVAERDSLAITTIEGNMIDLSMFADESFDLIVHPVSNLFIPDVRPVWAEAYRVLRHGGSLLSGFLNPVAFLFDLELAKRGILKVRYAIPYSDLTSPTEEERQQVMENEDPLEFGHTLEDQIGGQIDAGFLIAGFYEDHAPGETLSDYTPSFIATRATKP